MINNWNDNSSSNRLNFRTSKNDDVNENSDLIVVEKVDFFDIITAKGCEIDVITWNDVGDDDDDIDDDDDDVETVFDIMIFRR